MLGNTSFSKQRDSVAGGFISFPRRCLLQELRASIAQPPRNSVLDQAVKSYFTAELRTGMPTVLSRLYSFLLSLCDMKTRPVDGLIIFQREQKFIRRRCAVTVEIECSHTRKRCLFTVDASRRSIHIYEI